MAELALELLPQEDHPAQELEECRHGRHHRWRLRTAAFLESRPMHYVVLVLVLVDTTCVVTELSFIVLTEQNMDDPHAPLWTQVITRISLAITAMFMIEIPVTLWSLGWRYYYPFSDTRHAALHLFDAAVIVTTFVLRLVLTGNARDLASLLIVLRLWRFLKLGGVAAGEKGEEDEKREKALLDTQREVEETKRDLDQARNENQQLRTRIAQLERNSNTTSPTSTSCTSKFE